MNHSTKGSVMGKRRAITRLLLGGAIAAAVLAVATAGVFTWLYTAAARSNVGDLAFANELQIPPLLEPTVGDDGAKVFALDLRAGATELLSGKPADTWGFNGTYLGPTLRAKAGDQVEVAVTNSVGETTTVHWHGMHLPARMDGGPHQTIAPGETWSPAWEIDQPAASLWYHPHLHGETADHVYRGAAGMFILDDDDSLAAGLPGDYGIDDVPLIIQDKRFDSDGSLDFATPMMSNVGILGDEILVNGTHDPHFQATTSLVRFRVLNASNARVYNIGFADDRSFWLVGTDAGLLEAPHETNRVQLSSGERTEIVVAVDPGERAVLRSHPPDLGTGFWQTRFNGGDDTFDLLEIRAADDLEDVAPPAETLVAVDAPPESEAVITRTFSLSNARTIDGLEFEMDRIDHTVEVDSTEIWEITNDHSLPHSFHPHLIHFSVLDVDGGTPPPQLQGWKDTVYVPPGSTIRIIARFEDHADPDAAYMFHCHVLHHEDRGMMGQFVVVEPGDAPESMEDRSSG